jgi:hypothetical protein
LKTLKTRCLIKGYREAVGIKQRGDVCLSSYDAM